MILNWDLIGMWFEGFVACTVAFLTIAVAILILYLCETWRKM